MRPDGLLFADGHFWGAEYERTMTLIDVTLITPDKHKLGAHAPTEIAKARIRLVVESVFRSLKDQMHLERHLAETVAGFVQRMPNACSY